MESKTTTLGRANDNPTHSICVGHVNFRQFNRAFEAEGWKSDKITAADLSHQWWVRSPTGKRWTMSNHKNPKAIPVTVMQW